MIQAHGDQIKKEVATLAEQLFDDLKADATRVRLDVDNVRQGCAALQAGLENHQQGLSV